MVNKLNLNTVKNMRTNQINSLPTVKNYSVYINLKKNVLILSCQVLEEQSPSYI